MIVSIDTIDREAREAAAKFKTPNEACRYPFETAAGQRWKRIYNDEREALELAHARRKYDEAIAESSCIN
jgi:hypothetical protein